MKKAVFQFDFSDLKLNVSQIESVIGYKEGEKQEIISDLISDVLIESESVCRVKAEYVIYEDVKFHDSDKAIEINHQIFQVKKIF
jgi:hypothetical protein